MSGPLPSLDPLPWVRLAGVLQLVVAGTNLLLPRVLDSSRHLAALPPLLRQIHQTQSQFITLFTLGCAGICLALPEQLADGQTLGRAILGFLCLLWSLRLAVQLRQYGPTSRRDHPVAHRVFTIVFVYLSTVFLVLFVAS